MDKLCEKNLKKECGRILTKLRAELNKASAATAPVPIANNVVSDNVPNKSNCSLFVHNKK